MAKLGQQVSFAGNLGTGQAYQDALAAASAASQRLSSWKTGMLAPVDRNIVTGALRPAVPMFVQDAIRGVMAPGKAMRGEYGLTASPDGRVSYDGMADDAAALAGTVTLGAGAIPRPAGVLDMGVHFLSGKASDPTDLGWTFKGIDKGFTTGLSRQENRALSMMRDSGDFMEVELPIRSITATQAKVNPDFMDAAKSAEGRKDGMDLPAVVKRGGRYYATDGHHRITAKSESGKQTVRVRLYDLDQDTQTDFPLVDEMRR